MTQFVLHSNIYAFVGVPDVLVEVPDASVKATDVFFEVSDALVEATDAFLRFPML